MNILQSILEHTRVEVGSRKSRIKVSSLMEAEFFARETLSLRQTLEKTKPFAIIAEIKRASPSAGNLRTSVDVVDIARQYSKHGAAAISVLTDERFFSGSLDDLCRVRAGVQAPLLRKDFIFDEYQLFEAKACGADAVLLIAGILEGSQLADLHDAARDLSLECLVELYETSEIDILDFDRMKLVGINNRDLKTFHVDFKRSLEMARLIPDGVTLVSESGITSSGDLKRLRSAGIRAALIGEHFMKSERPGSALRTLLESLEHETQS
ncbi:MAG: indole-3-glycerol phosphate synthase TrpC [Acidobacteria bacterium]|nr:indole-3-glycerol phosphate synthase TrpC [Acidobacteriota bacterium]